MELIVSVYLEANYRLLKANISLEQASSVQASTAVL
jgi:hypothetical protein